MRKKTISFLLALVLLCSISVFASAASSSYEGLVEYTASGNFKDDFDFERVYDNLEPGDTATYTVVIRNLNSRATRWYMSNEVLKSLEESAAKGNIKGGAYDYILSYKGPAKTENSRSIFDSTTNHEGSIGGDYGFKRAGDEEERIGLHEATGDLEDYFFLDTLNPGERGTVTLQVILEGETQDNTYQETAARIQMNFAVEVANKRTAVKTGDENNLLPYYIGMTAAGLLFLYLALDAVTDRLYKKRKG